MFSDSYFTIKEAAQGVFRDRGSKFLAYAFPVVNENEIKQYLSALRKEHPSARHHCYAWRLGAGKEAWRANDDGEPSGTAGKPILGQIQSNDLTNVVIVVVRYFGGTLLGASGLINAYKAAAAEAIKNSVIEEKFIMFEYETEFSFDDMNDVMRILKENECKITSQDYAESNKIIFRVRKKYSEKMLAQFTAVYRAKINYLKTI
jgi:uncharacterized YigZ family protein